MVLPFFFFLMDETATHAKQTKIWLCQVLHFFRMKCTPTCSILHYSWSIIMVLFHYSEIVLFSLFICLDGFRFELSVENCFFFLSVWTHLGLNCVLRIVFSFYLFLFRFELWRVHNYGAWVWGKTLLPPQHATKHNASPPEQYLCVTYMFCNINV